MSDVTSEIFENLMKEQGKENNMENMTKIYVAVPTNLSEEVMSIISRYDGVPLAGDVSFDIQMENEMLKEKITELEKNVNLTAVQELEVCKRDKEIITNEYHKQVSLRDEVQRKLEYIEEDAKLILQGICSDFTDKLSKEDFAKFMSKFTDDQLDRYELQGFIPEKKYEVISVDVTMEKTATIKVVVPEGMDIDTYLNEIADECANALEDFCDGEEKDFSFMQGNTLDSDVDANYVRYAYSQEDLFYTEDVGEDLYD